MAHFAQLNSNNVVTQVIVVNNNELLDNGVESEAKGIAFCQNLFGGVWRQTSYNGNIRKNYAGIGYTYDDVRDAFIPAKPFNSWILNEATCQWTAPIPRPEKSVCKWDESTVSWVPIPKPFPSWIPSEDYTTWVTPIPFPNIENFELSPFTYKWNEETISWDKVLRNSRYDEFI